MKPADTGFEPRLESLEPRLLLDGQTPTLEAGPDAAILEGQTFVAVGAFTDPGTEHWTATVDYGDGTNLRPLILNPDRTFNLVHLYVDDATPGTSADTYTVTVTITDDDGGSATDTLTVTVNNVPPRVTLDPVAPISEGGTARLSGTLFDPGRCYRWISIDNLTRVDEMISGAVRSNTVTAQVSQADFNGTGCPGHWSYDNPVPGGGGTNYALVGTGTLHVNTPGTFSFAISGDDGGRLRIDGGDVIVDNTLHAFGDRFGKVSLGEGDHTFEWVGFQSSGGAGWELSVAVGDNTRAVTDANGWKVVGDLDPFLQIGLNGSINVTVYYVVREEVKNLSDVDNMILGWRRSITFTKNINQADLWGSGVPGQGHWPYNNPVPGSDGDNYAIVGTGTLHVNTAGTFSFAISGDDGGRLRIDGGDVIVDNTVHSFADRFGKVSLGEGDHTFEWVGFESGGDSGWELSVAVGSNTSPVSSANGWRVVGDPAPFQQIGLTGQISVLAYNAFLYSWERASLVVDWGDGKTKTVALADNAPDFELAHQYLDNPPSGGYPVTVTVTDDDTGSTTAGTFVPVTNLAPRIPGPQSKVVYFNDFDTPPTVAPGVGVTLGPIYGGETLVNVQGFTGLGTGTNQFAGRFLRNSSTGNPAERTILTLTNLEPHTSVDLNFLAAIIDSWDGGAGGWSPDYFNVEVDGRKILSETFGNYYWEDDQSYAVPPGVQLTPPPFQNRGFHSSYPDAAYNLGLDPRFDNIPHTSDTLTISWYASGGGWEGSNNESWAIENVEVILNGTGPGALSLSSNTVNEGDSVTVGGKFVDLGILDSHSVFVDWGDGASDTWALAGGARDFSRDHRYLDDNPRGDGYTINVTVADNDGATSNTATVTITVNPVNDAPVAAGDSYSVDENQTLTVAAPGVLGNDSDVDGDALAAVLVSGPQNGTFGSLTLSADGSFTYVPGPNFNGNDLFTYKANDGAADSNIAAVAIKVNPVNDKPVADGQAAATDEDQAAVITLTGSDIETPAGQLVFAITGQPAHGTVSLSGNQATYTPAANYNGPDSFTFTVTDTGDPAGVGTSPALSSAPATVTLYVNNLSDLSGRVFDDLDDDAVFEPDAGEIGLGGVTMRLTGSDDRGPIERTVVTASDGSYIFTRLRPGNYTVAEAEQPGGLLDGDEMAGTLGGKVDNTQDWNAISDIVVKTDDPDAPDYTFAEIRPSSAHGLVWEDFNNDCEVNFGERAIAGVTISLTGIDDRGSSVTQTMTTDEEGIYRFFDLRPGDYSIRETQPAGFEDGLDVPGTVNGVPTGQVVANDDLGGIVLPRPGSFAENYNFGERPMAGGAIVGGQTATIGFWQNKNGQGLVRSLNGGAASTRLGDWLAATFTNMFGAESGASNLAGKSNAEVAAYYQTLFKMKGPKLEAQVMAVALAVYATNSTLAGSTASAYGFRVTELGVGIGTFNVGSSGAAFGVANNTTMMILDSLLATDRRTTGGLLYGGDRLFRSLANEVYSAINEAGSR